MTHIDRLLAASACLLACSGLVAAGGARADDIGGPAPCLPGGRIVALSGGASAAGPGGSRAVGCGDELCSGDTLSTGAGASAGVLVGSVLTQLGPDTRATVGVTPQQTAAVDLQRGGVRMIDPREGGAPGRLTAGDNRVEISGNDAEVHLLDDGSGAYTRMCERAAPLHVRNGTDHGVVEPGSCATARSPLAPAGAAPGSPSIPALGGSCDPSPDIPPIAHVPPLPPVATPPGDSPPLPEPPPGPPRYVCEVAGGCTPGTRVIEPPPTTDPFPGGGTRP